MLNKKSQIVFSFSFLTETNNLNCGIFMKIDVRSIDSNDEEKQRKQDLIIARKADRDTHKCTRTD